MSYNSHANVVVKNNFPFAVNSIQLSHRYSGDSEQSKTWGNIASGALTSGALDAGYNTGFLRTGQDTWKIVVTLPDGTLWQSDWHQCTLESDDNGKTLTFEVDASTFGMNMPSGGCSTSMSGSNGYNSLSAIQIKNNFPVPAKVKLNHHYSDDPPFSYDWKNPIDPDGGTTPASEYFIVYFNTGFGRIGSDYWNIEVTLDVPPYDNQPGKAFTTWRNGTPDKGCMLETDDINKVITFQIGGAGWVLGLPSGSCTDNWKTPNGYNTTAFIKIKNDFATAVQKIVLTHKYSDDSTYEQIRTVVPTGQSTSPLMFVEYNTGFLRTGYDYWNVTVYLVDGKYYQNNTSDKRCYMTADDASGTLEFKISDSNFYIGLISGACNDGISYKGMVDYYLGRDVNKTYDKNAYLASHNSYANFDDGFWYAQQSMNMTAQLAMGVSCLLLDIWDYNSDICLIHETAWLKPFGQPATLAQGLQQVATYMTSEPTAVVTIIFEDHVETNRAKIQQSFQNVQVNGVSLWDMVFFADKPTKGWNVGTQGWPTLQWLINQKVRLVVFSSRKDPFPYQWDYMSENVYGDASLNQQTWLRPRDESQKLDEKALCALNHFPTWAPSGVSDWLTKWLGSITTTNRKETALTMFQQCQTECGRLPNYFQVDFFEMPNSDPAAAITQLNGMLHGKPPVTMRMAHNAVLLEEAEPLHATVASERPILLAEWRKLSSWIETHRSIIITDGRGIVEGEAIAQLCRELAGSGHYVMMLWGLLAVKADDRPMLDRDVQVWAARQADKLADHLDAIHAKIDWTSLGEAGLLSPTLLQDVLPLALISEVTGHPYEGLEVLSSLLKSKPAAITAILTQDSNLDEILLLQLLRLADTKTINWAKWVQNTIGAVSEAPTQGLRTLLYDLTHEVFYATQFGRNCITQILVKDQAESLQALLLQHATIQIAQGQRDLGAELLLGYWCTGGALSLPVIEQVLVPLTKMQLPTDPNLSCCRDCEPKVTDAREVHLRSLDQVVTLRTCHEVLTTTLAVGLTLALHGDVLKTRRLP